MMPRQIPVTRQRNLILAVLIASTAAAWSFTLWQAMAPGQMGPMGAEMMEPLTFLVSWTVMMAAMMFPGAAPMILAFAGAQARRRDQGRGAVPTWIFSAAYLLIWVVFGAIAYLATWVIDPSLGRLAWVEKHRAALLGVLLVAAGAYQRSPLKRVCLSRCRSPFAWLLGCWREGSWGAFRMGLEHGLNCLGCCWLLFVILFPLGVMNMAIMAALTLLIFVEKVLPFGPFVARLLAPLLVAAGLLLLVLPQYTWMSG